MDRGLALSQPWLHPSKSKCKIHDIVFPLRRDLVTMTRGRPLAWQPMQTRWRTTRPWTTWWTEASRTAPGWSSARGRRAWPRDNRASSAKTAVELFSKDLSRGNDGTKFRVVFSWEKGSLNLIYLVSLQEHEWFIPLLFQLFKKDKLLRPFSRSPLIISLKRYKSVGFSLFHSLLSEHFHDLLSTF